jgi:hypothetical protein
MCKRVTGNLANDSLLVLVCMLCYPDRIGFERPCIRIRLCIPTRDSNKNARMTRKKKKKMMKSLAVKILKFSQKGQGFFGARMKAKEKYKAVLFIRKSSVP